MTSPTSPAGRRPGYAPTMSPHLPPALVRALGIAALALVACGGGAPQVCERAVERHARCMRDATWSLPRPTGAAAPRATTRDVRDAIARCVAVPANVKLYQRCLALAACDEFLRCTAAASDDAGP